MSLDGYHTALVLGGIRSGNSEYAEALVADADEVLYVSTAAIDDADAEWQRRVEQRRPTGWHTEEIGTDPDRLLTLLGEAGPGQTVLVDDLGGWLSTLLAAARTHAVSALAEAVRACAARVVIVSPEVGLSVVPGTKAGRAFAEAAGTANRALAEVVDAVVLVVAGQPTLLKPAAAPAGRAGAAAGQAGAAAGQAGAAAGQAGAAAEPGTVGPSPAVGVAAVDAGLAAALGVPTQYLPLVVDPQIQVGMALPLPDEAAAVAATGRLRQLDVPGLGLGALTRLVSFVAGARETEHPRPFQSVRVLVVHGEHEGGCAAGEDALEWPRRLAQVHRGEGPLSLLAGRAGATIQTIDVPSVPELGTAKPIEDGDAMTVEAVDEALRYGWRWVDTAVDSGVDLLVLAAGGAGQQAAAAALVSVTGGYEPALLLDRVVLPGGRIDDGAWMERCAAVREALRRTRNASRQPRDLLAALGGPDLAIAVGVLLCAASRRTPVVVDGPVGVAAGLVAREFANQTRTWLLLFDHNGHPTVRKGADVLSLEPLVDLKLGLGEGASALAALPLLQAALVLSTVDVVRP
jgi:nicotinate-nucleotide--dimethylbenzimidazole phosphoribosyltransferase